MIYSIESIPALLHHTQINTNIQDKVTDITCDAHAYAIECEFLAKYNSLSPNLAGRTIVFRGLTPYTKEDSDRLDLYRCLYCISTFKPMLDQMTVPITIWPPDTPELTVHLTIMSPLPLSPLPRKSPYECLCGRFACYMRDSFQCKFPHLSATDMHTHFSARGLLDLSRPTCQNDIFLDRVDRLNQIAKSQMTPSKALAAEKKQPSDPLYFSIWRNYEWIDMALSALDLNTITSICVTPSTSTSASASGRKLLPAKVRAKVWKKHNKAISDTGTCYVCDDSLEFSDMECGHVLAHALGGTTTLDNLMPICRTCNRNMGIMNLNQYRDMMGDILVPNRMQWDRCGLRPCLPTPS